MSGGAIGSGGGPSGLEVYEGKRDFSRTPEPRGVRARPRKQLRYVVQKHDARRLHYDFRLEHDGVLKSWAVPKEPSVDPRVRRLAVETEDHPLDYANFEGEIPQGEYGAGSVLIWDEGYWKPQGDPAQGLADGKLRFEIHGSKLRGEFVLVRMTPRDRRSRKPEWLLMKHGGRADKSQAPDRIVSPAGLPGARRTPQPAGLAPQLATAVQQVPEGADWIFEPKLDGYRLFCRIGESGVRLSTRSGRDWTDRFPGIAEGAEDLPCDGALIDGEAVVFGRNGLTDFQRLQNAIASGDGRIVFVAFDLLYLDGYDLCDVALGDRKALLQQLLALPPASFRYGDHVDGPGAAFLREACQLGLEGILAKRAGSRYRSGRTPAWRKIKCVQRQEFVIVGFTAPGGSRSGFGALLLATRDTAGATLRFAGKVGTGFDRRTLADLKSKLDRLRAKEAPVADVPSPVARAARWVSPRLVAEIEFAEWTSSGRLRHPRFKGLREDKPATEVVAEKADTAPARALREREVPLTHPDKLLFPQDGITKRELADYWRAVAGYALPYLEGRPLMLLRCPDGLGRHCFYQKHLGISVPETVSQVMVAPDQDPQPMVDSLQGILGLVQFSALELHVWGSRTGSLEQPDVLVFDLDPDEGLEWRAVLRAAFELKELLAGLGLVPFARVTGGKGLHVVVPVEPGPDWPAVKKFTKAVAGEMVRAAPERYTASVAKRRRRGKIFIDYLRNDRGATAIAAYSPRARAGAPVALPVAWDELVDSGRGPPRFALREVPALLATRPDPWAGFEAARRSLDA